MNKKILLLGSLSYLVLGILSIVFYLERTVFLDISYHLFHLIKDNTYAIQNYRFGAAFTQTIPLLAIKLNLDLKSVMQLYSFAFVLYYFGIFLLCLLWNKSYKFGITMLLFSVLMVSDTFYWVQSEFPQGLAFCILYYSFILNENRSPKNRILQGIIIIIMLCTLAFFHPLLIIPFAYISIFFYIKDKAKRPLLIKSLLLFFAFYIIKALFFRTTYDSGSMNGLKYFIQLFPDYFSIQSNKNFLIYLLKDYYLLAISIIMLGIFYYKKMQMKKFYFIIFTFFAYLLLINVSYQSGTSQFYIENLYLPLSLILIFPIVFDLGENIKANKLIIAITVIVLIRIVHIGLNHQKFSDRIQYLQSILDTTDKFENKKLILDGNNVSEDIMLMNWGSTYEFWLLSSINKGETRSIKISEHLNEEWCIGSCKNEFLTNWGAFDYTQLPKRYFNLNDTSAYVFIKDLKLSN